MGDRGGGGRTAEDHKGCECGRAVASPGHRWQRWMRLAGPEGKVRRCAVVGVDDRSRGEWEVRTMGVGYLGDVRYRSLQELCRSGNC